MRTARVVLPFCAALTGALAIGASPARAQGTADDAAGIALFNEGKALRDSGDWEHAALKFAEAERLHPAAAILFNLAEADEHLNRLASAWGAWKDAEIMARNAHDASREQEAAARGAALAPKLAKLAIVIPPATRVPGLELRKDGALVGEGQWGSGLPADVGQHTIEASAPGHKAWSTVVRIEINGSSASVEVPALDVLATPTGETPAPFWTTQRKAGVIAGGAGLGVGAVLVAVFGGLAAGKKSASSSHCSTENGVTVCDPTGLSLRSEGTTFADGADVGLAVGGAAVVTGIVLFATGAATDAGKPASTGVRVRPVLGLRGPGLTIEGRW
jgi:hypothetical protein